MKSMAELVKTADEEMASSKFFGRLVPKKVIDKGPLPQTMQVVEKTVRVFVGLNNMARKLGVSRGHLSLVVHGLRKSERLQKKLRNMGVAV